ncbi:MAG: transporter substrate-binding domain-containing protein, partial [Woeseiaceae bacterium]|nr:transporter substrate-binding domain-containing protein [Woeseiaceae bacterium]
QDESGRPAGYAVSMCERIASGLRERLAMPALRSEFVAVGQDARFDAVQNGSVDLLCAGGTPTLALRESVSFSIPIFPGGIGALIHKDAPARLQAALAGEPQPANPRWGTSLGQVMQKRIFVAVPGSRSAAWLERVIRDFGLTATISPIENIDQGLKILAERKADVMFAEHEVLLYAVQHNAVAKDLTVFERKFTVEPIAFALPRGDDDFRLIVDAELSRQYRSGAWSEVYVPVFGEPDEETRRFFINTAVAE